MRCYWSFISLSEGAIKTIITYCLVKPNSSHPQEEHLPWTHLECGGHSCVQFARKWVLNIQIVITTAIDMINNNRTTVMMQWSSEALFEYVWLAKPLQENLNFIIMTEVSCPLCLSLYSALYRLIGIQTLYLETMSWLLFHTLHIPISGFSGGACSYFAKCNCFNF